MGSTKPVKAHIKIDKAEVKLESALEAHKSRNKKLGDAKTYRELDFLRKMRNAQGTFASS